MIRSIVLALVAALALAVGANAATPAADGRAEATLAKKKGAKCPAKHRKGKRGRRGGKSLAGSAKRKTCKPKRKGGAFKLADGTYEDTKRSSTRVEVSGGGRSVKLTTGIACFVVASEVVPLTVTGKTVRAGDDREMDVAGLPGRMSWSLTVKSTLAYSIEVTWDVAGLCTDTATASGKLVKRS